MTRHTTAARILAMPNGLLVAMLLTACNGSEQAKKPPPPPEVGFVVARAESVSLSTELAGRTAAFETSEVRPQVSGIVKARLFTEGSIVRQGQILYQIDPSLYEATAAQARANLASARANLAGARIRADRLRPLAAMEAVSKQDFTDAEAAANQAAAAVAQGQAQLDAAQINLRFTRVAAPISGRIGRSLVTTGALVSAGQADPLTTIQRLDPIFVDIQQSSAELLKLRSALASGGVVPDSQPVRLRLEDGTAYPLPGNLLFTEVTVAADTGTVSLRARFDNPGGLLLPGMFVRATLAQTRNERAILVPQQAVSYDPKGAATAFVIGADNKALLRQVRVDRAVGNRWLVSSGIADGERVVVESAAKLKPDQPVRPVPAGSPRGRSAVAANAASSANP